MDDKTMKIAAVAAIAIIAIAGVAVFMMNSDDGKDDAKFEIMTVSINEGDIIQANKYKK